MFQFFQMLLGYSFKFNKVNLILTHYFCIRADSFSTHMPWLFIIKIYFTNKVNTIYDGVIY